MDRGGSVACLGVLLELARTCATLDEVAALHARVVLHGGEQVPDAPVVLTVAPQPSQDATARYACAAA